MRLFRAYVPELGREVLVTVWPQAWVEDGDHPAEVAFRPSPLHTWSAPTPLKEWPS